MDEILIRMEKVEWAIWISKKGKVLNLHRLVQTPQWLQFARSIEFTVHQALDYIGHYKGKEIL